MSFLAALNALQNFVSFVNPHTLHLFSSFLLPSIFFSRTVQLSEVPGPKTNEGKKASSLNAQKGAIFTKGYLKSENIEQKQAQYEALTQQWDAYDPTRQMILRTIE